MCVWVRVFDAAPWWDVLLQSTIAALFRLCGSDGKFRIITDGSFPRQENAIDCGVFALLGMEAVMLQLSWNWTQV